MTNENYPSSLLLCRCLHQHRSGAVGSDRLVALDLQRPPGGGQRVHAGAGVIADSGRRADLPLPLVLGAARVGAG